MSASDEPQYPTTTNRPDTHGVSNDAGNNPRTRRNGTQTRLLPALVATATILGVGTLAALWFWPNPTSPSEIAAKETIASPDDAASQSAPDTTAPGEPAQTSPLPAFDLTGAYGSDSQSPDSAPLPESGQSDEPSPQPTNRSDGSTQSNKAQPNDAPSNRTDTKGRSSQPTPPPDNQTGPPKMVIEGPSTVDCWGPNHQYTVHNSGGPITSWLWHTGGLGLQSPATSGPSVYVSFDLDPGQYTIRVTANNTTTAIKKVTVRAAQGCRGTTPKPILDGPGSATCGATRQYSMRDGNGGPAYPMGWTQSSIKVSRVEGSATDLMLSFPSSPGAYQVTVHVGNGPNSPTKAASTTRTFTVQC